MEKVTTAFANAYRSQRLVYRDIENSDTDKETLHNFGPTDHVSWGLLSGRLFRDVSKKANFDSLTHMLESSSGLLLKVMICLPVPPAPKEEEEEEEEGEEEEEDAGPAARAARERASATVIGSLTLSALREGFTHAPTTTVGLCIGEAYQNQGYGSEAISWAVDWAFKFANVHKVEICTSSFNERAIHLYQKLGFALEGRKRHVIFVDRTYYDLLEFGMLVSEWERLRGVGGGE